VPSNTFVCADGKYAVISGNGDAIFKRLMNVIGRPDLADDPALADNAGRVSRQTELEDVIAQWTLQHDISKVLTDLEDAEVPSGAIYAASDIVTDPHYRERNMLQEHLVDTGADEPRTVLFPGIVPALQNEPGATRWLGPELGAHTDEVLGELGMSASDISAARERGVI
jgi:formyl-CoA transferase